MYRAVSRMNFSILFLLLAMLGVAVNSKSNHTVTEEVWLDLEVKDFDGPGDDLRDRIVIAMFGETTPMTCMNFQSLAKGFKRGHENLHYKNSYVHRIIPDFIVQLGDIVVGDGSGSRSIYGDKFIDENFSLSHQAAGYVSMANAGPDSNGSQFLIMLNKARWLDGRHVVFGKVVTGMDVIRTLGELPTNKQTGEPKKRVKIVNSGVMDLAEKYTLTEEQAASDEDLVLERLYRDN